MPMRHATHDPLTQNASVADCAAPGHSESSAQLGPHNPLTQYGANDSHSADAEHVSAMHWLPRHTSPSLQAEPTGMLLAAQSASSMQHRLGLGLVHATTASNVANAIVLIRFLSAMG